MPYQALYLDFTRQTPHIKANIKCLYKRFFMRPIVTSTNFTITKAAATRIAHLQELENAPFFRVSVDGGGCSGFQYKFDFDSQQATDDLSFEAHGVTVLVDDMSLGFLEGAQLDYVEELIGAYFKVENPNATASCGCGTSFSI